MKLNNHPLLITLVGLFLCFSSIKAQPERYFTSNKELSSNLINQIYQDHIGFIWIATEDGLNRFDGNKFVTYRHDVGNPHSLVTNNVYSLLEDNFGRFWVGTAFGLLRYDRSYDRFSLVSIPDGKRTLTPYIKSIIETRDHHVIVASSGEGIIDITRDGKASVRTDFNNMMRTKYINVVYEDRKGFIWVCTQDRGLFRYDPRQRRLTSYPLYDANITAINEDGTGSIIAASLSGNIYRLTPAASRFTRISDGEGYLNIVALQRSSNGNLFVCTDGQGVKLYNARTCHIEASNIFDTTEDMTRGKVHSLIIDNNRDIWLGLFEKGVLLIPQDKSHFDYIGSMSKSKDIIGSNCVMSIFKDEKTNTTWIGTDNDGMYGIDEKGVMKSHFYKPPFPNVLISIFQDSHGNLWGGSFFNGLAQIDRTSGDCTYLDFVKNRTVYCLNEDRKSNLWIGTYHDGLYLYNLDTHSVRHFTAPKNLQDRHANTIPRNWVNTMLTDHEGNLWIGTFPGLAYYDTQRQSFISRYGVNNLLPNVIVYCLCEDSKRHLWVGSAEGLYDFDTRTRRVKHYTVKDGLPNNFICAIQQDNDGNLWISSHYGLSKFNPKTRRFTNYYNGDGIQGNEFTRGATFKGNDGRLYFGGVNGVTAFYPRQIKPQKTDIRLLITNFYIAGKAVKMGDKSGNKEIINRPVYEVHTIDLSHDENSFTIELSAFEFADPNKIVYQYKLDNETEWMSLQPGVNQVTFSGLSSGTHVFMARAINSDVVSKPISVIINVRAQWYASPTALFIYLLFLIAIAYFIYRYIVDKINDKREIEKVRTTERMNESKLMFFINISHEIRTPMTLIINPLEKLIKAGNYPELKDTFCMMYRNSQQILHLINQIMDIRKLEKGQLKLKFTETDIIAYIDELMLNFTYQAQMKNIKFEFVHADSSIKAWIDINNFDKIILNILGNAFKYTPDGGVITISLRQNADSQLASPLNRHLEISVSDTGTGIDADKIGHVFERFYQINNPQASSNYGTGIGLNLALHLTELHHGTIEASNRNDCQGCVFTLRIPLGCEHLRADELPTEPTDFIREKRVVPLILDDPESVKNMPFCKNKHHILVVDDEDEMLKFICSELSSTFNVETSKDGKEALSKLLTGKFDLVISDVMMPVMNGIELCKAVKKNININFIPVILLTAKTAEEDMLEGLETGVDAYIPKPFSTEVLIKTISNLISNRRRVTSSMENKEKINEKIDDVELETNDEQLMQRVYKVINENLSNPDFNVEMLAQEAGISRVHFYRRLKEITNMSPHYFIKSIRLKKAAHLLLSKKVSISDAAYATGFSNLARFSNDFKTFFGEAPTEYQRSHTEESE